MTEKLETVGGEIVSVLLNASMREEFIISAHS